MDEDEWVCCDNCEESWNCSDANRYDGCELGISSKEKEEE